MRQDEVIHEWHTANGGSFDRPAGHALRILHEVVELCVASGARPLEVITAVQAEIGKATDKQEWDPHYSHRLAQEEWADCAILMECFRHHAGIDAQEVIRQKMVILTARKWERDADGVLWRPGKAPRHG